MQEDKAVTVECRRWELVDSVVHVYYIRIYPCVLTVDEVEHCHITVGPRLYLPVPQATL